MTDLSAVTEALKKPRLWVSVSELRTMQACGQKWFYEYVLGRRKPGTPSSLRGRAVHAVARDQYRRKRAGVPVLELGEVRDAARDVFQQTMESDGVRFCPADGDPGQALGKEQDKATLAAAIHTQEFVPRVTPTAIEVEVVTTEPLIEGGSVPLKGRLDLTGTDAKGGGQLFPPDAPIVYDLKTASRKEPDLNIHADQQLSVYALLHRFAHGTAPAAVEKHIVVVTPTGRTGTQVQRSTRSPAQLQGTLEALARVERMRMAGIIPPPADPGSWICSQRWCGHTDVCPFYVRAADRTAQEGGEE